MKSKFASHPRLLAAYFSPQHVDTLICDMRMYVYTHSLYTVFMYLCIHVQYTHTYTPTHLEHG